MKLLLTSNGITNDVIAQALDDLVGKPPKESKIAFIPTAAHAEQGDKHWLIMDLYNLHKRGYQVDVVELTALDPDDIEKRLRESDVIFVGGGNTFFLSYWMQKRGLFELIPQLLEEGKVYASISAGSMLASGSMALTSKIPRAEVSSDGIYGESNKTMSLVDFTFRPHLDRRMFFSDKKDQLKAKAKELGVVVYALDDNSAIKIVDKNLEVVGGGQWLYVNGEAKND